MAFGKRPFYHRLYRVLHSNSSIRNASDGVCADASLSRSSTADEWAISTLIGKPDLYRLATGNRQGIEHTVKSAFKRLCFFSGSASHARGEEPEAPPRIFLASAIHYCNQNTGQSVAPVPAGPVRLYSSAPPASLFADTL